MSENLGTLIESRFADCDGSRSALMDYKRLCAHLTLPRVLPHQEWTNKKDSDGQPLPSSFQARGRLGTIALCGQLLVELFPPGLAFWITKVKDEYETSYTGESLDRANSILLNRDLAALCLLENAGHASAMPIGFRTSMRQGIESIAVLGSTLMRGNPDYTLTVFRLDNYVVQRDDACQPIFYITREMKDVAHLGDNKDQQAERFAASKLDPEILKKPAKDRQKPLYTQVEYQPFTKSWVMSQSVNGNVIHEYDREVCNHISVDINLSPGDNYGHGFAESWEPDLFTADRTRMRQLEWMAAASRIIPVIDRGSNIRPADLANTPNGFPIFGGNVQGGVVGDVGFVKVDKMQDFNVVQSIADAVHMDLDRSMLTGLGQVRQSERTTAFEVSEVTLREKEASMGSSFSDIADTKQPQLVNWLFDEARRNKDIPSLPEDVAKKVDRVILTGSRAMAERAKAGKLAQIPALANQIGEAAVIKIKGDKIISDIVALQGVRPNDYLKTDQELEAEKQGALQVAAQQQAIASSGAAAESYAAEAAKAQFAPQ